MSSPGTAIRPWRTIERRISRQIMVGRVPVGGDAPITVQTMTNTPTEYVGATIDQIRRCEEAGADIIRVSCPDTDSTAALREIVRAAQVPIVADIHFHYKRALEAAGIWAAIDHKIVRGENIAQTLQFVQSGNAEIGIVALSLLKQPAFAGTRYYEIPQHYYAPIKQYAVVTKRGEIEPLAREFVTFLLTPEAQAVLARFGLKR